MDKIKYFYALKDEDFLAMPNSETSSWIDYLNENGFFNIKTYGEFENGFQLDIYYNNNECSFILDFSFGDSGVISYAIESPRDFITFMNDYKNFIDLITVCKGNEEEEE